MNKTQEEPKVKPLANTFYIEDKAWDKIIAYARTAYDVLSTEVGGMAVVKKEENGCWIISDPVILKQTATAAICHLDKKELSKWYSSMATDNIDYLKENKLMYCWWHSHHTMTASMSSTDDSTIAKTKTGLSLVVNNRGDSQLILSTDKPTKLEVECELLKVSTISFNANIKEDINDLVTKETNSLNSYDPITCISSRNGWGKSINSVTDQLNLLDSHDKHMKEEGTVFEKEDDAPWDLRKLSIDDTTIDAMGFELDENLEGLKENTFTPDEVISFIEDCNKTFDKPVFKVPPPDKIGEIQSATELYL